MIYYLAKRLFDIISALLALVFFAPFMLLTAIAVWFSMGRPIIFSQIRAGHNRKAFRMYKFRSMKNAFDSNGNPLSDAERLTKTGVFIRSLSLDELPQIWNILKGDMTLVGPRPLLYDFFPYYSAEEMRRHDAKPGVTGYAQVNGRNEVNWDDRLRMDVWYVDNRSFWLDVKILFRTVWLVLRREGVTTEGHATFLRLDDYRGDKNL
jgi:lipopolysaccharide/colanic/teichoic acid biosynthesis glycosyltransferase